MELPIPHHLRPFLVPDAKGNSGTEVSGALRCTCSCETFEIRKSNAFSIIRLLCTGCGRDILLFDAGKHGWDGFVCGDDFLDRTEPFEEVSCPKCGGKHRNVRAKIASQGKEDFMTECAANDPSFTEEDWVDAFEWLTVSVHCPDCGYTDAHWVEYETM